MRIQIARSAAEMERLRPAWERLFHYSASATMFQSYDWNRLAAACFGAREAPYVILAEGSSGMALLPAAISPRGITLLGEWLFDYRDGLWAGSGGIQRELWAKLAELKLPLCITALRGERAHEDWASLPVSKFVYAPQVLACERGLESLARSRANRSWRRLAACGAQLCQYDGNARDLLMWIYRKKSGQHQSVFRDPERVDFMVAAAAIDPAACEIFTLEISQLPIAALVSFRDRQVRRCYTIWFNENWARYSPGIALLHEVLRRTLAAGIDCDLMTGEQPYKMRFATSSISLFRVNASAEELAHAALGEVASCEL